MAKLRIAILAGLLPLFLGCSTVERRGYFSPVVSPELQKGPAEPYCGWANFGGLPDTYFSSSDQTTIQAIQSYQPYLFGPWFVSIVPVFPFTWIAETFTDKKLKIEIEGANIDMSAAHFSISIPGQANLISAVSIDPSAMGVDRKYTIKFPVRERKIKEFTLHIERDSDRSSVDIRFTKTSRWSWTQWTPNC